MKVLTVNTSDISGGAARAAYRLHRALLAEGINSQMLVQFKSSDDDQVLGPASRVQKLRGTICSLFDEIPLYCYPSRTKTLFSPAWAPSGTIVERINALSPDIVHLHWINGGMIRIEDIAKIQAPIVWSLHDMWAFTGGCHYDENCGAYTVKCGSCKVLKSKQNYDLSRRVWKRKSKLFSQQKSITVIGLSRWLAACASKSKLFKELEVRHLPNLLDVNTFKPFDKSKSRDLLGLPTDKKLILFGAMNAMGDPRKGFSKLNEALEQIDTEDTELVIFGSSRPVAPHGFKQRTHYLGRLHDDVSLRVLYSAADIMVVPSLQENLSNVIIESLACGTPVAAFNIGGNTDLVEHRLNGYLARPLDAQDLACGIRWLLDNSTDHALSDNAVKKVRDCFASKAVAGRYIDLYMDILNP